LPRDSDDALAEEAREGRIEPAADGKDRAIIEADRPRRIAEEAHALEQPYRERGGKAERVEIRASLDGKSRGGQVLRKRAPGIAAQMPDLRVETGPENPERGSEDKEDSARPQRPQNLRRLAARIVDVLEHVHGECKIVGVRREFCRITDHPPGQGKKP